MTVCENCRDPVSNSNCSVSSAKTIRWHHHSWKLGHDCSDSLTRWVASRRQFNSHAATRFNSTVESRRRCELGTLASPAMGHWGTCPPPRLPASYFGDHSLCRLWRVMCTVFCPVESFKRTNNKNVQNNVIFAQFLSIFGPFLSFFVHSFPQGVIIVPKMRNDRQ